MMASNPMMDWMRRRKILLAALIVIAEGCDRSDPPESSAGEVGPLMDSPFDPARRDSQPAEFHALHEWATADDYRIRVHEVKACSVEPPFAPREGHIKLGVDFEIEGTSARDVPANPLHAHLRASNGAGFSPTLAGCEPSLPARRVKQGESARGFLTFEIPEDAGGLVMSYAPFVVGRTKRTLAIDLGR